MRKETLRMERVTYKESGVTQLDNFSMTIWAGEILGLVPVNHHGLPSLIELCRQNLPLHYGYIYYCDKIVNHWRFPDIGRNRISIIRNTSCLAEGLTVADNVFVLRPGFRKRIMQPKVLYSQLELFLKEIHVEIAADAYVGTLSLFQRFVVELLKAVVAGCRLVVLVDISTFVSDAELEKIHGILRFYARKGISFLYIAAHFEETRQLCDRTSLMMNGQITKSFFAADRTPDTLFFQCTEDFDRKVRGQIDKKLPAAGDTYPAFSASQLCYGEVKDLEFSVGCGECLVLQDLDNDIFPDLLAVLTGEKKPEKGGIRINGKWLQKRLMRKIAVIQELPLQSMLFGNMSYLDNLCFTLDHRFTNVWGGKRIRNSLRREYAAVLGEEVFDRRIEELSERQQYDLIYTRILLQNPSVVFCVQPFKSAEVSLRIHIWELLEALLDKKIAVVILAVNLADSLALADRLIRIRKNEEAQEYERADFKNLPVNTPWLYLYREKNKDKF